MAGTIRDVMAPGPITLQSSSTVLEAAQAMRDSDIGNVIVVDGDRPTGIVTDRDIAIRVVADGRDPNNTNVADVATKSLETISPTDSVQDALQLMGDKAIRRLPVVESGSVVGVVSIGDLTTEGDVDPALTNISRAPADQ